MVHICLNLRVSGVWFCAQGGGDPQITWSFTVYNSIEGCQRGPLIQVSRVDSVFTVTALLGNSFLATHKECEALM